MLKGLWVLTYISPDFGTSQSLDWSSNQRHGETKTVRMCKKDWHLLTDTQCGKQKTAILELISLSQTPNPIHHLVIPIFLIPTTQICNSPQFLPHLRRCTRSSLLPSPRAWRLWHSMHIERTILRRRISIEAKQAIQIKSQECNNRINEALKVERTL